LTDFRETVIPFCGQSQQAVVRLLSKLREHGGGTENEYGSVISAAA